MNLKNTSDKLYIDTVEAVTENLTGFREVAGLTDGTDVISTADLLKVDYYSIKDKDDNTMNSGRVVNMYFEYDSTTRTPSASWAVGKTWTNRRKKEGNDIILHWYIPSRGWVDGWSGVYHQIDYSVNNGSSWTSLGDTGYDGGTMLSGTQAIDSQQGTILLNLTAIQDATQIRFRFKHKSYGTQTTAPSINWNHGISTGMGWGYTNITIQEIGV